MESPLSQADESGAQEAQASDAGSIQEQSSPASDQHIGDLFTADQTAARASRKAQLYMAFGTTLLVLFLIVFMIDTMPQYRIRADWRRTASLVYLTTSSVFAAEWLLRFYAFVRPIRYLLSPMVLLDALGIIPGFIPDTSTSDSYFGSVKWLRALQVLRVLRVLRLAVYSVHMYVTIRTLRRSMVQIIIAAGVIISLMLMACFLLFYAENDSLDVATVKWMRKKSGVVEVSPFQNVFFCMYWGFATITTVGYGDYTAVSPWGQVISCVTMFLGVFIIVFPTSIISNNFATEWQAFQNAQRLSDDRRLHYRNAREGLELAQLYNYANMPYGTNEEKVPAGTGEALAPRRPSPRAGDVLGESSSLPDAGTPGNGHVHIGPVGYGHMIDMTRKIERGLGIPIMAPSDIAPSNEAGQSLIIKTARSGLYSEALSALCERMALRLMAHTGLESADELARYLQYRPNVANAAQGRLQGGQLSVLEFRALRHLLGNVRGRAAADLFAPTPGPPEPSRHSGGETRPDSDEGGGRAHQPYHHGAHRRHHARRARWRLRSRLHEVASRLSLARTPTRLTVHEYMSPGAASDPGSPPAGQHWAG